jgi:hypothetical protein
VAQLIPPIKKGGGGWRCHHRGSWDVIAVTAIVGIVVDSKTALWLLWCCGVSFCWVLTSLWLSVGSVVASVVVVGEVRLPLANLRPDSKKNGVWLQAHTIPYLE